MGKTGNKKASRDQSNKRSALSPVVFSERSKVIAISAVLMALVWIVFGQTPGHGFSNYDDPNYVYQNRNITDGLSIGAIRWAFTHIHSENWHPLTTISHMLDCQLFGLNAAGHHFTNVVLHTITVLLLFSLLRQMTGSLWRSAFVAAIFGLHPLRVESVAWVAERKDVLSGMFFMLTLIGYTRYVRTPSSGRYVVMLILFACGLMSKPMLVTLPVCLLLLDYWPLQRLTSNQSAINGQKRLSALVIEKIPLFALSIAACAATLWAQQSSVGSTEQLPLALRVGNAFVAYVEYIRQMFWPVQLAPFYPHPENGLGVATIAASIVVLLALTVAGFLFRRRHPYFWFGWLWYIVMLLPVLGIIQVGWQARADRYTYLPQIGLCVALTWAVADLWASRRYQRTLLAVTAGSAAAVLAWLAFVQTSYWRTNELLWTHTLDVTKENDVAQNNLGTIFYERGQIDEALARFELATRLRPGNAAAQDNLARTLRRKGRLADAIVHARKALEVEPGKTATRNMIGTMLFQQGDVNAAMAEWREVINRHPDSYALNSLAWVLATSPDDSIRDGHKAVELARQASQLGDGNAPVLRTLAAAYAESGRFTEAIKSAQEAAALATTQGNLQLAEELRREAALYQDGIPLRAGLP